MTDAPHPSEYALEQYLASDADAATLDHVRDCAACRHRLDAMRASAQRYSPPPRAKATVIAADFRWKTRAALVTVMATAALAFVAVNLAGTENQSPTTAVKEKDGAPQRRQARALVEPRPDGTVSRPRRARIGGKDLDIAQGTLEAQADDGAVKPFTLKHTAVEVTVTGFMQSVRVTQRFENPFAAPVEAIYIFPLPEDSAVHAMQLKAGARVITATIQRREVARRMYEEAKSQGRRAALLDQERPNIFTQSVANLLPGETVEVTLEYVAPLRFDDGVYTLNFPMTVGPRYIPGEPLAGESQGNGTSPDTDRVPDASRITPPVERGGRDISLSVTLEAGTFIEDLWPVSHRVRVDRPSSQRAAIRLEPADQVPNKDFILRWRVSGDKARASLLAGGGSLALMLNPPVPQTGAPVLPKEMVFVIDTSGSMYGEPLDAAKRAMALAMRESAPQDTFMLIDFADTASSFHPTPLPATAGNIERAIEYLKALPSAGGTNQLDGIRAALDRPRDEERLRTVLLMTDGYIGNESEIFEEVEKLRGDARVFGFGIGDSVNHYLLSRLSEVGRGFYQYVRTDEDAEDSVQRFVRRIRRPLITDIEIEWGGLDLVDALPQPVPDLFDAQPVIIHGRYRAQGKGTVTLRGMHAGKPVQFEVPVELPPLESDGDALTKAWARRRIAQLAPHENYETRSKVIEEVTQLGLEYHLMTPYTSLVAVDSAGGHGVYTARVERQGTGNLPMKRFQTIQVIRSAPVATNTPGDDFDSLYGVKSDSATSASAEAYKQQVRTSLNNADLIAAVAARKSDLALCVKQKTPGSDGKLVFRWRIGLDGSVSEVTLVSAEHADNPVAPCIQRVIASLRFPKHTTAGEPVTFPFRF